MSLDSQTGPKLSSNVVFDLSKNLKQQTFFNEVMLAIAGKSDNRYFFYGGAVRGGKTSVCLTILILLAKKYPGSRWHIIRDSFTTLEETTIPSMAKFCPESDAVSWHRTKSNYHLNFKETGSKIFMVSESIAQDPELLWMDGLETNGIFLEQLEGLSEKMFEKARERAGSWLIDPMPPGIVLGSTNPTQGWFKDAIYDKHRNKKLSSPFYFLEAFPTDSPFVTNDQWNAWRTLDAITYKARIEGNWDAVDIKAPFAHHYNPEKHESVRAIFNPQRQIVISTDFNINPFAVTFSHIWRDQDGLHDHQFDEAEIVNGSVPAMIDLIKTRYGYHLHAAVLTGDAMGKKGEITQRDNASIYEQLIRGLGMSKTQLRVSGNPTHENSRAELNFMLFYHPDFIINPERCPNTCRDMRSVQCDIYGQILKRNRNDVNQRADYLDAVRYKVHNCEKDFIRTHNNSIKNSLHLS